VFKDYLICSRNSTVCGYPGRDFDWTKFCWDENGGFDKALHVKCPKVFKDSCSFFIEKDCEYLHVPFDWHEHGTIYRVRPNESMLSGKVYRGHKILKQTAFKSDSGYWYWRLEF
jgi:hypothetical protein